MEKTHPVNEMLPLSKLFVYGLQHVLAMYAGAVAVPLIVANALGLTAQVPIREVFLTSGASRMLHLGNRCVELKHGNRWQLLLGNRPAGKVIRALSWLGPEGAPAWLAGRT